MQERHIPKRKWGGRLLLSLSVLLPLLLFAGCGGGGGGGDTVSQAPSTEGVWDQMQWDQKNWQ